MTRLKADKEEEKEAQTDNVKKMPFLYGRRFIKVVIFS